MASEVGSGIRPFIGISLTDRSDWNEMQGGTCLTTSSVTPALDSSPLGPSLLTSFTSAVGGPFGAR